MRGLRLRWVRANKDFSLSGSRFLPRHIASLKKWRGGHGVPTIYVNDNCGRWQPDFKKQDEPGFSDNAGAEVARLPATRFGGGAAESGSEIRLQFSHDTTSYL